MLRERFDILVYNNRMLLNDLAKSQNKWVAFSKDRKKIINKSGSLKELLKKIKNREDLIVSFIQPADRYFSP